MSVSQGMFACRFELRFVTNFNFYRVIMIKYAAPVVKWIAYCSWLVLYYAFFSIQTKFIYLIVRRRYIGVYNRGGVELARSSIVKRRSWTAVQRLMMVICIYMNSCEYLNSMVQNLWRHLLVYVESIDVATVIISLHSYSVATWQLRV